MASPRGRPGKALRIGRYPAACRRTPPGLA